MSRADSPFPQQPSAEGAREPAQQRGRRRRQGGGSPAAQSALLRAPPLEWLAPLVLDIEGRGPHGQKGGCRRKRFEGNFLLI